MPDLAEHSSLLREGRRLFTNFSERMVNFIFCRKEFRQEHFRSEKVSIFHSRVALVFFFAVGHKCK